MEVRTRSSNMTIQYSCISRGPTILCSHQITAGNYDTIAASMVRRIPATTDTKTTYAGENNYQFHCVIENGMVYMCVADADFGKRQPYAYLTEIKRQFQNSPLVSRALTAATNELDRDFKPVMVKEMEKYSSGVGDNVTVLKNQVDEVKGIMTQNIEKVLERGENLEDLQAKTEDLENSSHMFQRTARKVHRHFWWKNLKMKIILAVVILVVLTTIVIIILATSTDVFKSSPATSASVTTKQP